MFRQGLFLLSFLILTLFFLNCSNADSTANTTKANKSIETLPKKEIAQTARDTLQLKPTTASLKIPIEKEEEKVVVEKKIAEKTNKTRGETPKKMSKKKKKRAKIKFSKTTYDFGRIKEGEKIKHKFSFKNTGNAPLTIKNVEVSCGCTFPSYPFIPIEPGKKGTIEVTFDSQHKLGRQKPMISVFTNGRPRVQKLYLEGFVE